MEMRHSRPRSLGVEKLLFVGDDGAGGPIIVVTPPTSREMGAGVVGLTAALFFTKHPFLRGIGAAVAAVVGIKYLRSRT